ncbi:MAG: DVU0298 family protein [Desulfosalsimonas sp.]
MTGSRALKEHVRSLLLGPDRNAVFDAVFSHPPRRIINALIARFYDEDALIRWRAVVTAGALVSELAGSDLESARVVMRRFMWMLNDESGGIGWGVPEAMGEAAALSPVLAEEYAKILCSFVYPDRNFLEHPGLQRGLLWGLGRLAQAAPQRLTDALPHILAFMGSEDPVHRGYAAWAAGNAKDLRALGDLERLFSDQERIDFFEGWQIRRIPVAGLARDAADIIVHAERQT